MTFQAAEMPGLMWCPETSQYLSRYRLILEFWFGGRKRICLSQGQTPIVPCRSRTTPHTFGSVVFASSKKGSSVPFFPQHELQCCWKKKTREAGCDLDGFRLDNVPLIGNDYLVEVATTLVSPPNRLSWHDTQSRASAMACTLYCCHV